MAASVLVNSPTHADFFRRRILLNAQYWRDYISQESADIPDLDSKRELIIRAIAFALDLKEAWSLAFELIVAFSPFMERRGHWEIWNQVLKRAVQTAECAGEASDVVSLTVLLGRLMFRQSRFKETVSQYRRTIRTAREIDDLFNEARACSNLGYHYIDKGRWYRADVLCGHALCLFEQVGSKHGLAHTENHLALLYIWQGLWDQARLHLEQACTIWQDMGDQHGLMYGYMNLGLLYVKMEQPVEALSYSNKALHLANRTGEELDIAKIYVNMGLAHTLQENFNQAEQSTRQAESIFRHFFNLPGIADVLENLGVINLAQQKWSEAIGYLEQAVEVWRALRNKHDEIQTIVHLGRCELARRNHHQAKVWLKEIEHLLGQYPYAGRYCQLSLQVEDFRRGLLE